MYQPKNTFNPFAVLLDGRFIAMLLGIGAVAVSVQLGQLETKYLVAVCVGLFIIFVSLFMSNFDRLFRYYLVIFTLSLPFFIKKSFFYTKHVGGAPGLMVTATDIVCAGLYALVFYRHYLQTARGPLFSSNKPIAWSILFFMMAGALSLINAEYPGFTLFELFSVLKFFFVVLLVMNLKEERYLKALIFVLTVDVFFESALALVQHKTGGMLGLKALGEEDLVEQNLGYKFHRASGTFGHPNHLAYFLEIMLPIVFALFLTAKKTVTRLWYIAVFCIGTVAIFITLSRGAWVTLPVSLPAVLLIVHGKKLMSFKTLIFGTVAAGLMAIAVIFAYPVIQKRFSHSDYLSTASRMPLNHASLSIARQYPLIGVGLNNFAEVFKRYDTTGHAKVFGGSYKHIVHNMYLLVLVEVGAIGLMAFMGMFLAAFYVAAKSLFRVPLFYRGILAGIMAGLCAHLFTSMVAPGFVSVQNVASLVYVLIGVVGLIDIMRNNGLPLQG